MCVLVAELFVFNWGSTLHGCLICFVHHTLQPGTGTDYLGRLWVLLQRQLLKAWLDKHQPEMG